MATERTRCGPPGGDGPADAVERARAPAPAESAAPPLPRGLRLRLTVAIPLVVTALVLLSGLLALWVGHPLFFEAGGRASAGEIEQRVTWAFAVVGGFAFFALVVSVALAGSIVRPLRELTSRVEALGPDPGDAPPAVDETEIGALGSALEGVVRSVSDLILESYTLRSLASGLVTVDEGGVITSFNAVAGEVFGVSPGEAVGRPLGALLSDGPRNEPFLRSLERALAGSERASSAEAIIRPRGGETVRLGYSFSPLRDEQGRALGLVLTFKDLAEQKLAEQLMRRTENLAVLGSIASGLVHEIRTPLGAARGYAEMLDDELAPDSELRDYTRRMVAAVDRMDALVRDLRTIGHPEPRAVEPQDLSAVARETVGLCRADERSRGIEVRQDYADGLPPVPADAEQIGQALTNLVRNAFEAVDDGGCVAVRTWREDGAVAIAVHNTGSYIPPEDQDRLFQAFYTTKRRGTGLGLAIAHQVIRAHGGRVAVASDPEAGTTFTVQLPLVGPDVVPEG